MAIDTIKFKRGVKSKLNNLSYGEPAYISDENELYIGTEDGVEKITRNKEVAELSSQLEQKMNSNPLNINLLDYYDSDDNSDYSKAFDRIFSTFSSEVYVVSIPAGRYYINKTINVPNGVLIQGSGKDMTIFCTSENFVGDVMFSFKNNCSGGIKDLSIDNEYSRHLNGIVLGEKGQKAFSAVGFNVSNLSIKGCFYSCIKFDSIIWQMTIDNVSLYDARYGYCLYASTNDCIFSNIVINGGYIGLYAKGVANKFSNIKIDWCKYTQHDELLEDECTGLYLNNCLRSNFSNIEMQRNFINGAIIKDTKLCTFTGITSDENGINIDSDTSRKSGTQLILENVSDCVGHILVTNGHSYAKKNIDAKSCNNNKLDILVESNAEASDTIDTQSLFGLNIDNIYHYSDMLDKSLHNIDFKKHNSSITHYGTKFTVDEQNVGHFALEESELYSGFIITKDKVNSLDNREFLVKVSYKIDDFTKLQEPNLVFRDAKWSNSSTLSDYRTLVDKVDNYDGWKTEYLYYKFSNIEYAENTTLMFTLQKKNNNSGGELLIKNLSIIEINSNFKLNKKSILTKLDA